MADEQTGTATALAGAGTDQATAAAPAAGQEGSTAAAAAAGTGQQGGDQGKDGKADAPKLHGAPEKYTDFKVPEGMELDKALIEKASPLLKELNLSQDGAQKLIDFYNEKIKTDAEASEKAWGDTLDGWLKQAKADAEIGGQKYDASVAAALKAVNAVFTKPEEKQAWSDFANSTGAGNHPVLMKLLARIGATIKEDGVPLGGAADTGKKPLEERLYPTMAAQ